MTWPAFFLDCFVVGFTLSVVSFVAGVAGVHFHLHWPFGHHAHGIAAHGRGGPTALNPSTVMAFLAWFGGTGYLLTSQFRWIAVPALVVSTLAGLAGAGAVFLVMVRVLWSPRENMTLADTRMIGALGRVTVAIREGGIGEVVYVTGGTRKSCGARSADGQAIAKGTEVVITGHERGIAFVRRWEDLAAERY